MLLQCNIMLTVYASICSKNLHDVFVPYCAKKIYALRISVLLCLYIFVHITDVVPKLHCEHES